MKKLNCIICVFIISILLLSNFCIGAYISIPTWSEGTKETVNQDEAQGNFLELESGSAILMEQNSGEILYEHNIHEQLRPASVTKVMTILLIMEEIDSGRLSFDDKISCSE